MKAPYADLTEKLGRPLWWDEEGVPRYAPFHPSLVNNIYAREVALFRIRCQSCGMEFDVCQSSHPFGGLSVALAIRDHRLHYGDPPNYGCCEAGPTMNSIPIRVLEYWHRLDFAFTRAREMEVDLDDDDEAP